MIPTLNEDHVEESLALLIEQFSQASNIRALIEMFANRIQDLETEIWDLLDARVLDNATGATLDAWGTFVGEPRRNRLDARYRAAIRLKIYVNKSKGRAENVIKTAQLGSEGDTPHYYEGTEPAAWSIDVFSVEDILILAEYLRLAKAAGTRGCAVMSTEAREDIFIWGHTSGAYGTELPDVGGTAPVWPTVVVV